MLHYLGVTVITKDSNQRGTRSPLPVAKSQIFFCFSFNGGGFFFDFFYLEMFKPSLFPKNQRIWSLRL
jgi:hypothetical protein